MRGGCVSGIVESEKLERVDETPAADTREVRLKKQIVPFEESNPAQEPLFVNYSQVAQAGGSIYIDVGVIPLDEILQCSPDANFFVLTRLVMSLETLTALKDQIEGLLFGDWARSAIRPPVPVDLAANHRRDCGPRLTLLPNSQSIPEKHQLGEVVGLVVDDQDQGSQSVMRLKF
jgi:hypothetical protein